VSTPRQKRHADKPSDTTSPLRPYETTLGIAVLSGAVLWLAFPPLGLFPIAWIAPAGWVWLVRRPQLPGRRAYRSLYLAGVIFASLNWYWIMMPHWTAKFGWLALALYLGCYLPVFIALARVAVHRLGVSVVVAVPIVWTGLEWVRGYMLTGFSMGLLGHTQFQWIDLIQISDLVGAYGVSFLLMLVAACLARTIPLDGSGWSRWPAGVAVASVAAVLAYGISQRIDEPGPIIANVAIIQGSIDTEFSDSDKRRSEIHRKTIEEYWGDSKRAVTKWPDVNLILWPESMLSHRIVTYEAGATPPPQWTQSREEFIRVLDEERLMTGEMLADLGEYVGRPLLAGSPGEHWAAGSREDTNSAFLIQPGGQITASYSKMHLVPFGETIWFGDMIPWLYDLTPLRAGLTKGKSPVAITLDGVTYAPNICFESTVPHLIRRQVSTLQNEGHDVQVLLNLTNDGWFWGSAALDMHLACNVFRAVECRRPLLSAANTGLSAHIDGQGRIVELGPRRARKQLLAEVRLDRRASFYLRHGDLLGGLCGLFCVAMVGVGAWHRMRKTPAESLA
jgi:apolipoprotein N-acyltransferase